MALNAYRQLGMNNSAVAKSLEKLSSGFRINRAGDDAAGLAISEKMKAQITGLETASSNAQDGISLIQTAEGNLTEVHSMLNRMVELATKSANGTYTQTERDALQAEVDQLLDEVDRISKSANFNGAKLLDGSLASKGGATTVTINGLNSTKSVGSKASYKNDTAHALNNAAFVDGDTLQFTVALENGASYTVKFTATADKDGKVNSLVAEDGTSYLITDDEATNPGQAKATTAEIDKAVVAELTKTDLGKDFSISGAGGVITLDATKEGTDTPAVHAMDMEWTVGGTRANKAMGVTPTAGRDEGREIKADDITEYDGTNYEDAVFTINGHKFVLLTNHMTTESTGTANAEYLRAVEGLSYSISIQCFSIASKTAERGDIHTLHSYKSAVL